jgi:hypothetical protein
MSDRRFAEIDFANGPVGSVVLQRKAGMLVQFKQLEMLEACSLKPKCLSATTRADFDGSQHVA